MNEFPTLIAAEIDKVLDIAYGTQREERLESGIRRAERS
jgi:hypothetical protein